MKEEFTSSGEFSMLKYEIVSRSFYRENPLTAGHPVTGTQVTITALENGGPCLVGDSPVEWNEANKKNVAAYPGFDHYENRRYTTEEANTIFEGKVSKLIADGFVFEVYPDMTHFMRTGELVAQVHQHPKNPGA